MFNLIRKPKNDLISSFFDDEFFRPTFNTFFDSNWKQDDDGNHRLEIEVPGFNQENLNVEMADGILTVKGETENRKIYKRYQLGNVQDVDASIKDGILSLKLITPKAETKQIELKS